MAGYDGFHCGYENIIVSDIVKLLTHRKIVDNTAVLSGLTNDEKSKVSTFYFKELKLATVR